MAFTKIGLEYLMRRIKNRCLIDNDVPWELDVNELVAWFKGYAQCQNDILEIIQRVAEEQKS